MKILQVILLCLVTGAAHALPLDIYYTDGAGVSTPLQGATVDTDRYIYVPAKTSSIWTLQWDKNSDAIDGYYVYFGNDITTPGRIRTVPHPTTGAVVVTEFTTASLNLVIGQQGCFRIVAYADNYLGGGYAESGLSKALCVTHSDIKSITYSIDGMQVSFRDVDPKGFNFKMAGFTPGAHTLTALITFGDTTTQTKSVTFNIAAPELPTPDIPGDGTVIKKYP